MGFKEGWGRRTEVRKDMLLFSVSSMYPIVKHVCTNN